MYSKTSILHRASARRNYKDTNKWNRESGASQYEKEQEKLRFKQNKRAELARWRGQQIWGDKDDKLQLQAEERRIMDNFLRTKQEQQKRRIEEDRQFQRHLERQHHHHEQMEERKTAQHRAYMTNLSIENKLMAEQKALQEKLQRHQEKIRFQHTPDFMDNWGKNPF